jgi:hypothetical protein
MFCLEKEKEPLEDIRLMKETVDFEQGQPLWKLGRLGCVLIYYEIYFKV